MEKTVLEFVWKDRKRIFGLPITFTKYSMTEDRLFVETGLLSIKTEEVLLYRVRDISLERRLTQRIFGVGSIHVVSSDKTSPELLIKNVKMPMDVKELLHRQVEDAKIKRRMHIGEITGDFYPDDDMVE